MQNYNIFMNYNYFVRNLNGKVAFAAKTVPNSSDFSFDPKNDEKF